MTAPGSIVVLHLEDSGPDALMVETILLAEWPQCRIHRVASRTAFESALEFENFDLILSDHSLPGFDGLSALEIARTRRPEKPFIFLSGTIDEERAVLALQRGAVDYVIKDRPGRLAPAIRQALTRVEEAQRRRSTEEALRQNQDRFRQIAENVADMIAVLDLEGRRIYNNPAYAGVLGDPSALRGTDSFAEIHPDDRERVRAAFHETVGTGRGQRLEYRFLLPDDTVRHIESQGSVIRNASGGVANVLVVSRDVTARRQAEERLHEQAALLDQAHDAIYVRDLEQRITYWNGAAERVYGWSRAEVIGQRAVDLLYKTASPQLEQIRRTVLETGEWNGELRQLRRSGEEIVVAARRTLLRDPAGRPVAILNVNTDITEKKKLEAQFLRTQRMESIGTLTGGIAHDLNNVLAPILMGTELLRMAPLDPASAKIVGTIENSAQHGAGLVRQLLGFARGTGGERAEVKLGPLLDETVALLRQTLPHRIEVKLAAQPDLAPVSADATQLKQVVLNLCINARDAMPGGGTITIGAANADVDAAFAATIPEAAAGPHVHLRISDTGTGIPPHILEKIFDPFFTTKEVGKGTGLGLSTVRGIVKGHHGFLHVESSVGVGTTFHLFLPALQRPLPAPPCAAVAPGRQEAVLVVDPDPAIRQMLAPFLEHHGYRVLVAADGPAALAAFRAPDQVAAAIVDETLTAEPGARLIATLRALRPGLPIVAIRSPLERAAPTPDFGVRAVDALVPKPLVPTQLLAALRTALDAAASA